MLAKIQNINTNRSGLSKRGRASNFEKYLTKPFVNSDVGKDSISFSPGALYLSAIKWQLNEISYPSSEKVLLDVFIDGYEFISEFDFNEFFSTETHKFTVKHKTIDGMNIITTSADFSFVKEFVEISEVYVPNQIYGVDELFDRIHSSEGDHQNTNTITDEVELMLLLSQLEDQLADEFQVILNQMYTFIDKLNRFNIHKSFEFAHEQEKRITVDKVTSVYG